MHLTAAKSSNILKIIDRGQLGCLLGYTIFINFSISLTQLSQGVGVALWLTGAYLRRNWKTVHLPLLIPFLLFSFSCVLSTVTALNVGESLHDLKMVLRALTFFWIINCLGRADLKEFFSLVSNVLKKIRWNSKFANPSDSSTSENRISTFATILFLSCAASLLYALLHAYIHRPGSGMTSQYQVWVQYWNISWPRIFGAHKHVFTFSGITMLIGIMALAKLLLNGFNKWLFAFVLLATVCLGLTLTRHAWLGFFVASCILFFYRKPVLIIIPPLLLVALYFVSPMILGKVEHTNHDQKEYSILSKRLESMVSFKDFSSTQRFKIWEEGWDIIKTHPLTGCGLGCLHHNPELVEKYPTLKNYKDMHNNVMQILVATGFLGLFSWLSIWVGYFWILFRKWKQSKRGDPKNWIFTGSFAISIGFLIAGIFASNFFNSKIALVLYYLMALPLVVPPASTRSKFQSQEA